MSAGDIAVVPNLSRRGAHPNTRPSAHTEPRRAHQQSQRKQNPLQSLNPSTDRVTDKDIPDVMELKHQETKEESNKKKKSTDEVKSNYLVMILAVIVVILVVAIVWYVLKQNKANAEAGPPPVPPHMLQPGMPPGGQYGMGAPPTPQLAQMPPHMQAAYMAHMQPAQHTQQHHPVQQQAQHTQQHHPVQQQPQRRKPTKAELAATLSRMAPIKESSEETVDETVDETGSPEKKLSPSVSQLQNENRDNNVEHESPLLIEEIGAKSDSDGDDSSEEAETMAGLSEEDMEKKMASQFYDALEDGVDKSDEDEASDDEE
jgi:Ca2+/H+ antiporter